MILGEKEKILYGNGVIKDSILGVDFLISSKSFFQVNPIQVEKLYSLAIDNSGITKDEDVFDAYCGIGTISLIASKKAKSVIGVEIVKEAIKDAKNNAKINNINNATFICDDASNVLTEYANEHRHFDCVFIDPPRKGVDERFINALKTVKPKKVVYISCEPETLARDLSLLQDEYEIKYVQPVDMFPFTFHVESVVSLELKA